MIILIYLRLCCLENQGEQSTDQKRKLIIRKNFKKKKRVKQYFTVKN